MLNRFFGEKFHSNFHFFVLLVLLVGLCCSKFLMSMGLLLGGLNFFLEGNLKEKLSRLKENKFFLIIFGFYLLHVLGMLWTQNWDYGLNELRQKSSLGIISIIIFSRPLPNKKLLNLLLLAFISTLVLTSISNFIVYTFFSDQFNLIDIREMSRFGSHIRYGILIGFGVAVCYQLQTAFPKYKWFLFSLAIWFAFYTYYSQVLSGIISLVLVVFGLIFWKLFHQKKFVWLGGIGLSIILLFVGLICYLKQPIESKSAFPENYVTLKTEWDKRAKIPFDSLDLRKQHLSQTLERYLISKNLPVRGDGVNKLTEQDIEFIQKGFADIRETKSGLGARLFGVRYQLHNSLNPNGHSILERIEYWKNASEVIKENWLFGVGTGDINDEIQKMYAKRKSPLNEKRRLRAHNSYLTFWMTFGILGLCYFVFMQMTFFRQQWKTKNLLGLLFILISAVTFLFEDTLETQMGITYFSLFYALFSNTKTED